MDATVVDKAYSLLSCKRGADPVSGGGTDCCKPRDERMRIGDSA